MSDLGLRIEPCEYAVIMTETALCLLKTFSLFERLHLFELACYKTSTTDAPVLPGNEQMWQTWCFPSFGGSFLNPGLCPGVLRLVFYLTEMCTLGIISYFMFEFKWYIQIYTSVN